MRIHMTRALLLFSALLQVSCHVEHPSSIGPTSDSSLASTDTDNAAAYPGDLRSICHAHAMAHIPADRGFSPIASWLRGQVASKKAAQQLRALWTTDPIEWMQAIRRDAVEAGVSPCPLADTWEQALKRSWSVPVTPSPGPEPLGGTAPPTMLPTTATPSTSTAPGAPPAGTMRALDQPGCPPVGQPPYPVPAREAEAEGLLIVRCIVEPDGSFGSCTLLRSHPMFDSAVKLHFAGVHVRPFTAQGMPVRVACNYPFRYKLQ
jgi:TonB family protein